MININLRDFWRKNHFVFNRHFAYLHEKFVLSVIFFILIQNLMNYFKTENPLKIEKQIKQICTNFGLKVGG